MNLPETLLSKFQSDYNVFGDPSDLLRELMKNFGEIIFQQDIDGLLSPVFAKLFAVGCRLRKSCPS
jgi:hypothetical protein